MAETLEDLKEGMLEKAGAIEKQLLIAGAIIAVLVLGYFLLYLPSQKENINVYVYDSKTGSPINANVVLVGDYRVIAEKEAPSGFAAFGLVEKKKSMRVAVSAKGYAPGGAAAQGKTEVYLQKEVVAPSKADFLIISSKSGLERKYGPATAGIIRAKMNELARAAEGEGLETRVLMIDEAQEMQAYGVAAADTKSKQSTLATVKALNQKLAPAYLLIVGGERIVPFQLVQNPLAASKERVAFEFILQESPTIETDNPYGVIHDYGEAGNYYPEIAVGRMPDGNEESAEGDVLLIEMLDGAISQHKKREQNPKTFSFVSDDSFLDYYDKFEFMETGNQILKSPAFYYYDYAKKTVNDEALDVVRQAVARSSFLVILLHGNAPGQEQALLGKGYSTGEELLSLTAPMASDLDFTGKVVLVDSCWGANTDRSSKGSIAFEALRGGAKAFVGSTQAALSVSRSSYKGAATPQDLEYIGVANSMLYLTFKNALQGQRLGDAFTKAKRSLSWGSHPEYLTAQEFVFYGDPTLYA